MTLIRKTTAAVAALGLVLATAACSNSEQDSSTKSDTAPVNSTAASSETTAAKEVTSSSTTAKADENKDKENKLKIVTSTQIWADVAHKVVSDQDALIHSIIVGDSVDPHSFEPAAADMAEAKSADIIIVGGGGYDAWLYEAVDKDKIVHALPLTTHHHHHHGEEGHEHEHSHGHDHAKEEGHEHEHSHGHDHAKEEGHEHEHGKEGEHHHHHREYLVSPDEPTNEHIWYDTHAVNEVAKELAEKIKELKSDADVHPEKVTDIVKPIHKQTHALPAVRVAQTEPIADYILLHSEITEATPASYRLATLKESEPTAADYAAFIDALNKHEIDVLVFNPQTATDATEKLKKTAEANNIPVVLVKETPAKDENFFDFLAQAVNDLEKAAKTVSPPAAK